MRYGSSEPRCARDGERCSSSQNRDGHAKPVDASSRSAGPAAPWMRTASPITSGSGGGTPAEREARASTGSGSGCASSIQRMPV